ncbi:MAG: hypothetical protein CMI85_00775 [Candidatus Pelagibacter sp.]|nr:hypothetical protein [Candidatus Pelagibacter sp.]|tara:strand:- start:20784 stop:21269 length:486 start_codon:yes stop_codon:yes gene_type:complete
MIKIQHLIYLTLILPFLISCGFSPILKNVDLDSVKINKIEFSGSESLTYYLKTNLNMVINNQSADAYALKIKINESASTVTKNTAGITTEEKIIITINFQIISSKGNIVGSETLTDDRVITITNDISTDDEVKRIEKENIMTNLIQQLTFAVRAKIISLQK